MKNLISLIPIFALGACVSFEHYTDPVAAQDGIKCDYDSFSDQVSCHMQEIGTCGDNRPATRAFCSFPSSHMYFKTVFTGDKEIAAYGLNGYIRATDWKRPYRVTDNTGKDFDFEHIDSKVESCAQGICRTKEYISIHLDRNYIVRHINTGISMKVYGKRGSTLITIPAAYVVGFNNFLQSEGL